jgi:hypothetical protein
VPATPIARQNIGSAPLPTHFRVLEGRRRIVVKIPLDIPVKFDGPAQDLPVGEYDPTMFVDLGIDVREQDFDRGTRFDELAPHVGVNQRALWYLHDRASLM